MIKDYLIGGFHSCHRDRVNCSLFDCFIRSSFYGPLLSHFTGKPIKKRLIDNEINKGCTSLLPRTHSFNGFSPLFANSYECAYPLATVGTPVLSQPHNC